MVKNLKQFLMEFIVHVRDGTPFRRLSFFNDESAITMPEEPPPQGHPHTFVILQLQNDVTASHRKRKISRNNQFAKTQ